MWPRQVLVPLEYSEGTRPQNPANAAARGKRRQSPTSLASEVGDWRRFPRAAAFAGFCGLVPSEYSSGTRTWRGHITKTGNAHLRAQLVESAWSYQHRPAVGADLRERQQGLDPQ